jgi:hypothetical protein
MIEIDGSYREGGGQGRSCSFNQNQSMRLQALLLSESAAKKSAQILYPRLTCSLFMNNVGEVYGHLLKQGRMR